MTLDCSVKYPHGMGSAHTLLLIGKLLWVIRKHKRAYAIGSYTVVEKGGKKEREKECVVALTQPSFCALERREIKFRLFLVKGS